MKDRRDYVGELEEFEDYLSVGQTMLQELDDMVTGHTSAQAKVLLSKAEVNVISLLCHSRSMIYSNTFMNRGLEGFRAGVV